MRWAGFRKVRGQVCKRISRRIAALGLPNADAYRSHLESTPDEWKTLDSLCRVTISRFYRDRGVFDYLRDCALPRMAKNTGTEFRCWVAGCASGEEAYTMRMLWELCATDSTREKKIRIIATDSDPLMLERAEMAVYPPSSLKDLPQDIAELAFERAGGEYLLKPRFKNGVHFEIQDIRELMPEGPFDMILCRNLVFTYFDEIMQSEILHGLAERLCIGGVLVIGIHESLPAGDYGLEEEAPAIYGRVASFI